MINLAKHWKLVTAIGGVLLALVSGGIGYIANDYFSFRAEERSELRREYFEAQTAAQKVLADLQQFSDQATGRRTVTDSEKETLRRNVRALYLDTKQVAEKVPEVGSEFEEYAAAMVDLQNAALEMTGPADAKPFVENLNRFLNAQNAFDSKVQSVQQDYLGSWL